jgi:high affinity Mn2+ porin
MNLEQKIVDDLGIFARAGFASGNVEPDSYTDIDQTVAAGLSLTGKRWGRPDDTVGFAAVANAITSTRPTAPSRDLADLAHVRLILSPLVV